MEIFPWKFEIFSWRVILEIYPLKIWKFLKKICFSIEFLKSFNEDLFIGDFSLKNSFGDFSFDDLNIFLLEIFPFKNGDFSLKIYFGDFSIEFFKNFNEDLFIGDFSFDDLNIFNEDLFIGDFFFEKLRFFLEIFPFEDLFKEIFPWKFENF